MIDNKNEEFPIVDEMGNILGAVTRGHAHDGSKILHPVVHLHVFNSRGDLYLQHRPAWKDIQPDKWDTACGGHVDLGESVSQALHREILARYKKLNLAPYKGFINPKMTLEMDEEGEITDVVLDYEESYVDQMLRYSDEYGTL